MRNKVIMLFVLLFLMFINLNCASTQRIPMANGHKWLSNETVSPAANVDGIWQSKDWGKVILIQAQNSRDVTGSTDDGWKINGVVSDKKVFLLFSDKDIISYSAILTAESDNKLTGVWARELITEQSTTMPLLLQR